MANDYQVKRDATLATCKKEEKIGVNRTLDCPASVMHSWLS